MPPIGVPPIGSVDCNMLYDINYMWHLHSYNGTVLRFSGSSTRSYVILLKNRCRRTKSFSDFVLLDRFQCSNFSYWTVQFLRLKLRIIRYFCFCNQSKWGEMLGRKGVQCPRDKFAKAADQAEERVCLICPRIARSDQENLINFESPNFFPIYFLTHQWTWRRMSLHVRCWICFWRRFAYADLTFRSSNR